MGQTGVNKSQLAQKMHTSRTVVNRLLDEKDTGVTITTLVKAGRALRKVPGSSLVFCPLPLYSVAIVSVCPAVLPVTLMGILKPR
jgi:DNA-binding Xre family transcriptional regulator